MNRAERRKKNNGDIIKKEIKVKVDLAIDMMLICLKISMREHRISEERIENIILRANEILIKKYKVDGKSEWERCQNKQEIQQNQIIGYKDAMTTLLLKKIWYNKNRKPKCIDVLF